MDTNCEKPIRNEWGLRHGIHFHTNSTLQDQSEKRSKPTYSIKNKYFYTFDLDCGRSITIAAIQVKEAISYRVVQIYKPKVLVGYSVRIPEDTPKTEEEEKESIKFGKRVSLGRALKPSKRLDEISIIHNHAVEELLFNKGLLRSIALTWAKELKKNPTKYIIGIREAYIKEGRI